MITFEGRAPRLGATLRIVGGKPIGRVNSVIGAVDRALIHVHPIDSDIDSSMTIGSPVEIAPREKRNRERKNDRFDRRGRDGGRGGYRERRDNRGQDRSKRGGDWTCPKCKNSNFAFRNKCNRCEADRPKGSQGRDNRGRDGGRGGYRERKDNRSQDRSNRSGDWTCPKCKNSNFAFRNKCNRCEAEKPKGSQGNNSGGRREGNNRRPQREGGRRVFRGGNSDRNSRGRSTGSSNKPRRGGFRGTSGGSSRRNRPGRGSGRR